MKIGPLSLLILIGLLISCESTSPTIQSSTNAEVTYDGLVRVDNSVLDAVWIRPGIDLSKYDQLMLVGAGIRYRSVPETNRLRMTNATEFPLDQRQRRLIEESVQKVFREELAKSQRFEIVQQPSSRVLALTGALIDVVSFVPPRRAGRTSYYLSQLGAATLVLELSDSMSGQVLARAIDGRGIDVQFQNPGGVNPVSNRFELEQELDRWADVIRNGLESLASTPILPAQN